MVRGRRRAKLKATTLVTRRTVADGRTVFDGRADGRAEGRAEDRAVAGEKGALVVKIWSGERAVMEAVR